MKRKYTEHFDFSPNAATCKYCLASVKCAAGSSSGLLYHLRHVHQIDPPVANVWSQWGSMGGSSERWRDSGGVFEWWEGVDGM